MGRTLVYDVEADGLLDTVTKIHCICCQDPATNEKWGFRPHQIKEALEFLSSADTLVAHNGIGYDFRALARVEGWRPGPHQWVRDTLVWASLCFPDLARDDLESGKPSRVRLDGSHSLRAWGVRLGVHKSDYQGGFETFTEEMFDYCGQDVEVGCTLLRHLMAQPTSTEALLLEQEFALISETLSERGFSFDREKALALCGEIEQRQGVIRTSIQTRIPARIEEMKTPAYWSMRFPDGSEEQFATKGMAEQARKSRKIKPKDVLLVRGPNKTKSHEFNPGSRNQVRDYLLNQYQWISPKLTEKGEELLKEKKGEYKELAKQYGKISEDILRLLDWEESHEVADFLMLGKRLSQIRDGKNGWLKLVTPEGRIHHRMIPLGTPTSRCRHGRPNLSQVPHVLEGKNEAGEKVIRWGYEGRYGADCRALFHAREGYTLVGTDLSGIEARMLAHFLHPYDKGAFAERVLTGDIHQANADSFQRVAGYSILRNDVKTPFYAFCYACGREKQGLTIVEFCKEAKAEYQDVTKTLSGYRKGNANLRIASLICWGKESPCDYDDKRFRWVLKRCRGASNFQEVSSLAYSVVGGRAQRAFIEGIGGMEKLLAGVESQAKRGYLAPLDGRRMPVRKEHAALNTLLQGSAAIVMKRWVTRTVREARKARLDAHPLAIIHDELQAETLPSVAEQFGSLSLDSIRRAGEHYKLNIRLDGETKFGRTWADTH